ncbi:MAG: ATP-dependent Clp protease ATP-binding subunit, partial [Thermodesulfobacteriota bacterium]|nr:ATP-dependent Clp protease ATP-binding subunit [Thermodesulfobacteriota bacterium]
GLAQKIEMEPQKIPPRIRNAQIVNLQMNSVVSGTMFRGMFEDRIEKIINEIKDNKNIILFIDEAHTLIGAGTAMGVHSDAANIFKSTLARGEVQIIGATTPSEYKTYIQEDEALDRRFKIVKLEEPSIKDTRKILFGIRDRLEKNYSVKISDSAIQTALSMSPRYIRQIRLPDKAISWLNTACVKVEIQRPQDEVKPEDIVNVISQESGIPLDMVFRDTNKRFADVEGALSKRIIGQKEAIKSLAKHLRLNKGPLKENFNRPDGVLLFLGPTGVGKTEMAKSLAEFLFGDENKMVRLDMSEYKDGSIGIDKLIGMPRGIVGSERGGILTNQIRDNPFTVLLLDEMEKASSLVLNLFLQVFDEGYLTDGRGKKVYFSDTVIVMTSNLGSHEFMKFLNPLGFLNKDQGVTDAKKAVMKELENTFSPEFLNRIDDIIVFSPLSKMEVKEIAKMYLEKINNQLKGYNKKLQYTHNVLDELVDSGFSLKYGARFLKRSIDDRVKIPLTLNWDKGSSFDFKLRNKKLRITSNI